MFSVSRPWLFSMFTFRLLIPAFHANRNGWIRSREGKYSGTILFSLLFFLSYTSMIADPRLPRRNKAAQGFPSRCGMCVGGTIALQGGIIYFERSITASSNPPQISQPSSETSHSHPHRFSLSSISSLHA